MRLNFQRNLLLWSLTVIVAIASVRLGWPKNAIAQSAREIFRAAYENRYTWETDFPGYAAEVSINDFGILDQGLVRVKPDLSVEVLNIKDDDRRELIANQVKMEIIHRKSVPFEERHGEDTYELEGTDATGAYKIREKGTDGEAYYKVKNNIITQVNRTLGDLAVTVDTLGTTNTPDGYLVSHFQTVFRNPNTGEILQKQDVRDFHEKISKYYLLTYRAIREVEEGNPEAKPTPDLLIRFNDIQPL
ncbi:MAG: DUF3386 family protein [Chroococcales cyanobacterium]